MRAEYKKKQGDKKEPEPEVVVVQNGVQLEKFHVVYAYPDHIFLYIWTNPSVNFG